jgi:hypothetical protein
MSLIGVVGTYAWVGSDRDETIDRMQKSVDVLQSIWSGLRTSRNFMMRLPHPCPCVFQQGQGGDFDLRIEVAL